MVDLHTHILPGIDDGASSVRETQEMIQSLINNQVDKAVCTPHFDPSKISLTDFIKRRDMALSLLGSTDIILITGSETVLHDYLFFYPDISHLAIDNSGYILIELPYTNKWDPQMFKNLEKVINLYHLHPVIAHIERYKAVIKKKKNIKKLIDIGCLLQLNAGSVLDQKTRRRVIGYLRHGYIDVLASDCHNMNYRPPNLKEAYEIIRIEVGSGFCSLLQENAEDIVSGRPIKRKTAYVIE